jgi:acetylornithine deacetylase/succinyl-diaminopimelate desuccinylase-like protein
MIDDASLRAATTELLRALIRIDTSNPPGRETPAALEIGRCLEAHGIEYELVARHPDRANLVARIRGAGDGPSLCFLGHTDVVPAEDADRWAHAPFLGDLDDEGFVWGRGAADMKNETATRAVAFVTLARSDFQPRGDVVLVCQADEEAGDDEVGLVWLVHERPDIACDYAIDEGGGMRLELADGRVVVTLSVGEKATLPARVTALGDAGHASNPSLGTNALLRLAELIERIGRHRPERVLTQETQRMLETLAGSESDLDAVLERAAALHPLIAEDLPPLLGDTVVPTRLKGPAALNVIPARASVDCDCRLLPGRTAADLERSLRRTLGDDVPHELEILGDPVGGTSSPIDTSLYRGCQSFLDANDPGAALLPTLLTGFCDMHYLRKAFDTVAYGFWPLRRTPLDVYLDGVHAHDERIHVDDLVYAVRFHLHAAEAIAALSRA